MKELLSIKEFSKLSGISQTTLRHWEESGLFFPVKRDMKTNYRYYSPDQMVTIKFISVLSNLNIPLKEIRKADSERTPEKILALIEQREKQIDMELHKLRECYSIINTRRELISYGIKVLEGYKAADGEIAKDKNNKNTANENGYVDVTKIAVLKREGTPYILGSGNNWNEDEDFYKPLMNFCNEALNLRINLSFPIGGMHESWDRFLKAPGNPDYFISLDPTGNRSSKAGNYLTGFAYGYYGHFGDLPARMTAYIEEKNLTVSGPVFSVYLHDEVCVKDISHYLSQVYVAVSKNQ
ncbi:MAG: MerR family transcriptional regulator [Clostridiales bacterium]|nr:MerR family transcriptional regulator [Clostridiales bacterium]